MKDSIAKDIMTKEVVVATPQTTIEEAIKLLVKYRITGLPVVDGAGKLVGVISEYDIIESLIPRVTGGNLSEEWLQQPIPCPSDRKVIVIPESASLEKILQRFVKTKNRRLPVVNKSGKLVGVITRRDIIRLLFYRSKVP
jgi:CBS domain-containing protein